LPATPPRRLVQLLAGELRQGLSPHEIALTLAIGLCLSVPPALGTTTIFCATAALLLRLNQPLIQAVNFLAYPLQLVLLIPFLRAGEWLFGEPRSPLSPSKIVAMARADLPGTIASLWTVTWHGLVVWAAASVPVGFVLYRLLRPAIERLAAKVRREQAARPL
jgi:uncharacterized protein (DUF2062 family)